MGNKYPEKQLILCVVDAQLDGIGRVMQKNDWTEDMMKWQLGGEFAEIVQIMFFPV